MHSQGLGLLASWMETLLTGMTTTTDRDGVEATTEGDLNFFESLSLGLECSGTCSCREAEAHSLDRSTCCRATSFETGASSRRAGSTRRHVNAGGYGLLLRAAKVPTLLREPFMDGVWLGGDAS